MMKQIIFIFVLLYSGLSYGADFYYSSQSEAVEAALLYGPVLDHEFIDCWGCFYSSNKPANPSSGQLNAYFYPLPYTKMTDSCRTEYEVIGIETTFSGVNDSLLIIMFGFCGMISGLVFLLPIYLQVGR